MDARSYAFDAEEIAAGIANWVRIESPSCNGAAVNRMMDPAAETMAGLGAEIAGHGRYSTFQLAEVAIPRTLFAEILRLIDGLRPAPLPP